MLSKQNSFSDLCASHESLTGKALERGPDSLQLQMDWDRTVSTFQLPVSQKKKNQSNATLRLTPESWYFLVLLCWAVHWLLCWSPAIMMQSTTSQKWDFPSSQPYTSSKIPPEAGILDQKLLGLVFVSLKSCTDIIVHHLPVHMYHVLLYVGMG